MKAKLLLALLILAMGGWSFPLPAAAISYRNAASGLAASGAIPLTVGVPAGTLQNDVMVAAIAARPNTVTVTPPAGWTALPRIDQATATASSLLIYYRVATAGDVVGGVTYTWCLNSAAPPACTGGAGTAPTGGAGGITSFGGVDTTTPIGTVYNGQTVVAGTSFPAPALTTTVANTMVMTHHEFASSMTWANPTNMAQAFQQANLTPPASGGISIEGNYVLQAAIATIGPGSCATATTPGPWCAAVTGNADPGVTHILGLSPCAKPSDSSYVSANAQNGQATVYWSSANPVVILRKSAAAFSTEAPADGTIYTAGQTGGALGTATVVYDGAAGVAGVTCTATSCTQTGLTNGTTYYYKVFAKIGTAGALCYAPGTVNTTAGASARPASGAGAPAWSYMLAGGSILKGGTAGSQTIYATSNAKWIVSLNTSDGTQSWAPVASNAAINAWLTWLPVGTGGVKSVQSGTKTLNVGATGLPEVVNVGAADGFAGVTDLTRSVLFFSLKVSSTDPGDGQVRGQLTSTTNIQFNRANDTSLSAVTIQWYVVEFKGGVLVQRGQGLLVAGSDNPGLANLSTPVDPAKSFVLVSCMVDTGDVTYDTNDYFRALLTSPTQLEITHGSLASAQKTCDWQVVEYSGASVQRGMGSLLSGDLSSGPIALTSAVDPTKSFVQVTWRATSAPATPQTGPAFLRAQLTGGGASVTIDRAVSGVTIDYAWEVVSFTDGTIVQGGNLTFGAADLSIKTPDFSNFGASGVDSTRAVAFLSGYQRVGSHAYTLDDDVGPGWFTTILRSCTGNNCLALRIERQVTGSVAANAAWFVVQFPQSGGSASVIGVDQGTGSPDQARLYSVDPAVGTTNWQVALTGADQFQAAVAAQVRGWSSAGFQAAYTDDVLFAATLNTLGTFNTNNRVFARSASDGALLWTFSGTMDSIAGMPYVDYVRDRLYVASRAGSGGGQQSLWVIKTVDGEGVLKGQAMACPACTASGRHFATSPTLSYDGNTLYIGDTAGNLHAINAGALTLKWTLALGTAVNGFVWEDVGISGRLYFAAADGTVRCIRDNGTSGSACTGWTVSSQSYAATPLVLGKLFVGSWDPAGPVGQKGQLYQINLTTGAVEKTVVIGDGEKQPGDVSTETGNEIFVGTTEGKIFKFPLTGGSL